jgi:endoglucanase
VLAMAARIYEPYDAPLSATCLAAANLSYGYLQSQTSQVRPDLSAFTTGGYTLNDSGARLWAAAEIFETTGSPAARLDLENRIRARAMSKSMNIVDGEWDWGNPGNLGIYTYLLSSHDGRDPSLLQKIKEQNQQHADEFAEASEAHAYGRAGIKYVWGANGTVARIVMNLQIAYRLSGDKRYLDASLRQIDHLFGRNYYARSQVTGIGDKPVLYPHHRPSVAIGRAWPGLLVGGPNPLPTDWVDSQDKYEQNEVALNWNAALVYALAGFASGTNDGTGFYDGSIDAGLGEGGAPAPDATPEPDAPSLAPDAFELDAPDDEVIGD